MTEAQIAPNETVLTPDEFPDVSHLITEDDTPVDNWFSEKQMRLLTHPLYEGWAGPGEGRPFVMAANVGLYHSVNQPALVPSVFLSLDVTAPEDWWEKRHRVYFVWEFGKPPDVAIEIVSNTVGGELDEKMRRYARAAVPYYVVFDPLCQIQPERVQAYVLHLPQRIYTPIDTTRFDGVGLGLTLWTGEYEGRDDQWLRWQDADGQLIPTGQERVAEAEREIERERQRSDRLAAQLRALGVEPEDD